MPKNSEKTCTILLRFPCKSVRVDLFPAELWPDRGGRKGLYRLRIDGKWHAPAGLKWSFLSFVACMARIGSLTKAESKIAEDIQPRSDLPKGSRVRVPSRVLAGEQLYDKTTTITPPIQGIDGRWRVFVIGRAEPVLVEDLGRI